MKALNPSTGNLEEVYVKALDSMPVGSQIEFTGNTIPTGWEEVNDYSTTEIDTGKQWIDGKPIYRKVIEAPLPAISPSGTTNVNIPHNISNFGITTSIEGMLLNVNGIDYYQLPLYASSGNLLTIYQITTTNIILRSRNENWSANSFTLRFIIEYTKTS